MTTERTIERLRSALGCLVESIGAGHADECRTRRILADQRRPDPEACQLCADLASAEALLAEREHVVTHNHVCFCCGRPFQCGCGYRR